MVVTLHATQRRDVVKQALDLWTDDFASVGLRTPATNLGDGLIAGPNWNGTGPAGVKQVFRRPTHHDCALVQMSSCGPRDWPAVHALQGRRTIAPLASWGKACPPAVSLPIEATVGLARWSHVPVRTMTGAMFRTCLAALLKDNPPQPADVEASAANGWMNPLNLRQIGTDCEPRTLVGGLGALTADDAMDPGAFLEADGKAPSKDRIAQRIPSLPKDNFHLTARIDPPEPATLGDTVKLPTVRQLQQPQFGAARRQRPINPFRRSSEP